jgi:hypothetical protein
MKRVLCLLMIGSLAVIGATKKAAKKAPSAASVEKTLIQMERDWVQAGISKDSQTIDRIIADDWISTDFQGKSVTKAQAMSELKSASGGVPAIELGEMKVRVLGTTAIVSGKDTTGRYAWMDVFLKRNGRWQAVASQSTKVEP